jgi:hypothetical protein
MKKKEQQELFSLLGRWRGNDQSKFYQSEFFKVDTRIISNAEHERRNQPYETQQELVRLLNDWCKHASKILKENNYDVPEFPGLFSYPRDKILDTRSRDARDVIDQASNVYRLLFKKDKCVLALAL